MEQDGGENSGVGVPHAAVTWKHAAEMVRYGAAELHNVAAILGGIGSQVRAWVGAVGGGVCVYVMDGSTRRRQQTTHSPIHDPPPHPIQNKPKRTAGGGQGPYAAVRPAQQHLRLQRPRLRRGQLPPLGDAHILDCVYVPVCGAMVGRGGLESVCVCVCRRRRRRRRREFDCGGGRRCSVWARARYVTVR